MKLLQYFSCLLHSFIDKRTVYSCKKNFIDSFCFLLPLYSSFCFIAMIDQFPSLKIDSWGQLTFVYCFFVFILPGILAANHCLIFASILNILRKNKEKISHYDYSKSSVKQTTYHENELKISKLFKK